MGGNFANINFSIPQIDFQMPMSGVWMNPYVNTNNSSSEDPDLHSPIFSVRKKAEEKRDAENAKKYAEYQEQIKLIEAQQKEDKKLISLAAKAKEAEVDEAALQNAETGEKAEAPLMVAETKEDFKKIGFWKKLGRLGVNALSGAFNCGLKMLGIEEFGLIPPKIKVNWKQLGKTALSIAAIGAATCIPVVGPFVLPALTALGVGLGGVKVIAGGIKAMTTDDPEAFDNAAKSLGEGAVIAGLSVAGIKKMGGVTSILNNAKTAAVSDITAIQNAGNLGFAKTYGSKFAASFIDPVKAKIAPRKRLFDIYGWKSLLPKKPDWKWYQWVTKPAIFAFWTLPCKPFGAYYKLAGSGYAAGYNIQRTIAPVYEKSIIAGLIAGTGAKWMGGDQVLTTKQKYQDENGNIVEQEVAVTKTLIAEAKERQSQYDEMKAKLKAERDAIYA